MNTLLVAYDLNGPGQNYEDLIEAIKESGAWWHHLDSAWLVNTNESATAMRDKLKKHLDGNDELLVIDVTTDGRAWTGFNDSGSKWLKETFK